jgi:hypothetical protein
MRLWLQWLRIPAAALAAPELSTRLLAMRGQQIANSSAQLNLLAGQNDAAATYLSGFYGKSLTGGDLNTMRAGLARLGVPPNILGGLTDPTAATTAVNTAARFKAGGGTLIQPTPAGPDQNLAPTAQPLGATVGAGPRAVGASPTDIADNQQFMADQAKSAQLKGAIRPLQQALPLVGQLSNFNFGPASGDIAKVKSTLQTLGIAGVDPTDENTVRQEVSKKLNQYVTALQSAGRSDQALSASIASNPNLDMTQAATLNLIKNQIGMSLQDAAVPDAQRLNAKSTGGAAPWTGYQDFRNRWYTATDPRGFAQLSKADIAALGKNERSNVFRSIDIARTLGLVQAPTE